VSSHRIPAELRQFLAERINTYEELEALLLIYRRKEESLPSLECAQTLKISAEAAELALDMLARGGLIAAQHQNGVRRYQFKGQKTDLESVADLARAYEESPLEIIKLMTANAIERMRNHAMQTFADSFIVGKGKKDG
jgi:hypothetical protein